jgi:pyruvate dehydrogenase E1 component
MPAMPEGAAEGILKGMYQVADSPITPAKGAARPQLLGSGPILRETLRAQSILAERYGVASDVWSVTSYRELRREALEVDRWNLLHPGQSPRKSYLQQVLSGRPGPYIAASDYMRLVPEQIARWLPGELTPLGTDGFGRSDTREALRRHFEVDAEHIAFATLSTMAAKGQFPHDRVRSAARDLGIDSEKIDPAIA